MKSQLYLFVAAVVCGLFAGCSTSPQADYESVGLVSVSGTVMLDGKPLPDAVVIFEDKEGQYSAGKTNAEGKYTLQFDSQMSGVTPGEKTVRISTTASLGEGMEEEAPRRRRRG